MAEFNPEIKEILKEFKIDRDQGLLCLLGIYHKLDVEKVCSEETIKSINLTKIVEKDYKTSTINWNIPLFEGQETEFNWVVQWLEPWSRINPDRRASPREMVKRMKDFFAKYPEYRKEDVFAARDLYLKTVAAPVYLKDSATFIFEGKGGSKMSHLLKWCERVKSSSSQSNLKGKIIT